MGQWSLLNFARAKTKGKTDQIWLFYDWPTKVTYFPTPLRTRRRRSNKVLMLPPPAKRPILSPGPTSPCRHRRRRGVDQQNMSAYCECAADRRVVLPKTGEAFNIGIRSISFPHYHSPSRLLAHKLPSHKAS